VGGVERSLWLLQAAALIVLVIACSNVASLFLARAIDRRAEVTVRRALGAQRFAATTTLLAEGLLIGLAGAVLGLFIAWLGTSTLVSLSQAHENVSFLADRLHDIPRLEQVRIDGRSFGFALSLSLLCGLLMAFVAGYQRPRAPLSQWLGGAGKAAGRGRIGPRLRAALIVVEVALAFSLAVSCGLLLRHYSRLSAEPAGFDAAGVVSMEIHLPPKKYARDFQIQAYYSGLETQLASLPGVESVGQAWGLPLSGLTASSEFEIENRPRPAVGQEFRAAIQPVSPGYFRTLRIPLVSGRFFEAGDNAGSKPVALINQTLARRFFPGEDPVGKKIQFDAAYPNLGRLPAAWREIV
ncbi:MAG TPA: ABC transporter permease, partial [Thermoanaerobaculia bacterium]|nr:ABC transporter permease [Thermoanaerobaculia bacterium]